MIGDTETTIEAMRVAARVLSSVTASPLDEVKAVQVAINALEAAKVSRLAHIDEVKLHEADGASSITTWARREIGEDAQATRRRVRAASTFKELPTVAEAARQGRISQAHVDSFTYALKHVGVEETRLLEEPLVELARELSPKEFHAKVRAVRDRLHPDDLDKAWLTGMDKHDIKLARTPEGWHLTGFLDVETGGLLNEILSTLSVPRVEGDTRSPSQRRMDGLHEMCQAVVESGLPGDNGIRPHLNVTVDADTLRDALSENVTETDVEPATLEGFGPIGPQLLAYLVCGAELTPLLVKDFGTNTDVLDVGRSHRFATVKQAAAIRARQHGLCANQGCLHQAAHIHHVTPWSEGGVTDLDVMIGLCRKCHTLIHSGQLFITGRYRTGFVITSRPARGSPQAHAA